MGLKKSAALFGRGEGGGAVNGGAVFGGGAVYKYNSYPLCSIAEKDSKVQTLVCAFIVVIWVEILGLGYVEQGMEAQGCEAPKLELELR